MRVDRAAGRVSRVTIRSTRPFAAARVLVGRRAEDAAALVPRLYSVCSTAQGAAAAGALESAHQRRPSDAVAAARSFAVALENLQEDLRRLLIDIPRALGEAAEVAPVAAARRAFAPVLSGMLGPEGDAAVPPETRRLAIEAATDAVSRHVLGEPASTFAARGDAAALGCWAREANTAPARSLRAVMRRDPRIGTCDVATLPRMTRDAILSRLVVALDADPAFAVEPSFDGVPRETGALARMSTHPAVAAFASRHGRGVAARLAARVADVARTAIALGQGECATQVECWPTGHGAGVACVETARGLLLHRAELRGERVARYAIVAPTEWNFRPGGPLERSLAGLDARDAGALRRDAALVVQSLDPCVACDIEVRDA